MSFRWSEEDYHAHLAKRGEAFIADLMPKPKAKKRDRYAENAGELGQKIHANKVQIAGQIKLWLPYPPSTNMRMAIVNGRMLKSAEAKSYQRIVRDTLVGLTPLTGDLEVAMTINRPMRRGDIDNVLKNVFDALKGIAFVDDEQIAMLDAKRYDGTYAKEFPGIHIQIKTI
jgi:Holliday junction resolvase RusA-like endonuclease